MRRIVLLLMTAALAAAPTYVATAAPAAADVATAAPAAADVNPPIVTVLERGDGPRTELRYTLTPGTEQLSKLAVLTRIGQQVGDGQPASGSSPRIEFDVRTTVTDVATDGVITATYVYEALEVGNGSAADSAVAEQVREQIEPILGLVGTLTMTDQGQVLTAEVAVPSGVDPATAALVEQLSNQATSLAVPFPTEAVGEGGRWKAATTATVGGITLRQSTIYEVVSVEGKRLELTSTLRQRAKRQTYTDPATGEAVELLSSAGDGDGENTLVLDQVVPRKGEAHVQVRQKLRAGGQRISQTITTHVFVDPAPRG